MFEKESKEYANKWTEGLATDQKTVCFSVDNLQQRC